MTVDGGKENFRLGFLTAIELADRGFVGGLLVTNHFGRPLEFQCTAPLKPNRTQEILYGPTLVPYVLGDLIGRTLIEKIGVKPHLVLTERDDLLPLRDLVSIPVACVADLPADAVTSTSTKSGPKAEVPPEASAPIAPETSDSSVDVANVGEGAASLAAPSEASLPVGTKVDGQSSKTSDEGSASNIPLTQNVSKERLAAITVSTDELQSATKDQVIARQAEVAIDPRMLRLGRQMLRFHAAHEDDQAIARRGAAAVPNDADLREPFERVREALNETAKAGGGR